MNVLTSPAKFSLSERYEAERGKVLLSGIQALVRALQTRAKLDAQAGIDSGGFVSGYRGSPLGGLDKELWQHSDALKALNVHFQPGVNEDLAATAVWGTQQVGLHPGNTVDGVYGMWYGKAPGLDRSCDAIRHANAWGTSPKGGVVLVVGDDPAAKSSSLATQSEFALKDMMLPILAPSSVQDVLDFTLLGWEMSRYSGLWVGLKAIADHMDSSATVSLDHRRFNIFGAPGECSGNTQVHIRTDDTPQAQEVRLLNDKLPRALEFARLANINVWETRASAALTGTRRVGIVCAGKAYSDVREALAILGYGPHDLTRAGIHLLRLGMTWPLDEELVRQFSDSVEEILVVEEKRDFVESQVKQALYGHRQIPVLGKFDRHGQPLLPATGILEVVDIARILQREFGLMEKIPGNLEQKEASRAYSNRFDVAAKQERTPLFCAGCPHNTSTRVPDGSRATAGIGCHYMVQWMDRATDPCTHMGGEGVTWVGESPFTDEKHIFANLGDGTYFHSGILAIRQAVASGVNITYKILFNDAVAMTGGQPTDGDLSVPGLVAQLKAEGVERVVVVSDDPSAHDASQVQVFHRSELDAVQRSLAQVGGVTVLVYEQTCATELRRRRKRGLIEDRKPRLVINEAVCEGCGDCTVKSNCVAVEPVHTPWGLKRQINQTACNKDLSCSDGFCPAFVEIEGDLVRQSARDIDLAGLKRSLPFPALRQEANVLVTGVGGTGIVTVSALLAAAAKIEGKAARSLDMTGLAQKGGAVFSHIRIGDEGTLHTPRIPLGSVDTLIGCDLITAASNESLELLKPDSLAAINTHVLPTADFVLSGDADTQVRRRLGRLSRLLDSVETVDADRYVQTQLGDTMQANVFLLGYAFQKGGLPLTLDSLEQAIEINAQAVERNLIAFHLGRQAALLPAEELTSQVPDRAIETPARMALDELVESRASYLASYQNEDLALRFRSLVNQLKAREQAVVKGSQQLARACADSYSHVLAFKDEFEVARLHLDPDFEARLARQFGTGVKRQFLLAPPLLGTKKRRFGAWMTSVFRLLASMRRVRNTILDPFRYTQERKLDLALIANFEAVADEVMRGLNRQNLPTALALLKLPLTVRGFGHVKAAKWREAEQEQARLLEEFRRPAEPVTIFDPQANAA